MAPTSPPNMPPQADLLVMAATLERQVQALSALAAQRSPATQGGRLFHDDLMVRIEGLGRAVEHLHETVARVAQQGIPSPSVQYADLVRLAHDLLEEMVAIRRDADLRSVAKESADRIRSAKSLERHQSLVASRDSAIALLEETQSAADVRQAEAAMLTAQLGLTRVELQELNRRIAQGEGLLGTVREQALQARRNVDAMQGMSSSLPFQFGYLTTAVVKRPHRMLDHARSLYRFLREALQRLEAKRKGASRKPKQVVGVQLPQEWQQALDTAAARSKLGNSHIAIAVAAPKAPPGGSTIVRPQTLAGARVAIIADEFTRRDLGGICVLLPVGRTTWRKKIAEFRPHLLLVESAWRGNDGEWTKHVEGASTELRDLVAYCSSNGIATLFWNKEDPVHFDLFLSAASMFDYVATTDLDSIALYCSKLRHDRVFLMPFAANPNERNPIEVGERREACSFAGSYYAKYGSRNSAFEALVAAVEDYVPVEIYDRNGGDGQGTGGGKGDDPEYAFPARYQPLIVGTLPYSAIDVAYKGYRYGITLNSSPDSQTMVARRIFDLLASNTVAISNYSRAIRLLFGDLVISSDDRTQVAKAWECLHRDPTRLAKIRLMALRKVLAEHTVAHRMAHALNVIFGHVVGVEEPYVTVVGLCSSQGAYEALLDSYSRQQYKRKCLKVVLADGFTPERRGQPPEVELYTVEQAATIAPGEATSDGYIACFAPSDYYAPQYLLDLVLATRFAKRGSLGKDAHYTFADGLQPPAADAATYRQVSSLAIRRSLVPIDECAARSLAELALRIEQGMQQGLCFALDVFSYCANGAGRDVSAVDGTTDVDAGMPMDTFLGAAGSAVTASAASFETDTGAASLQSMFPRASHAHGKVKVTHARGVSVASTLDPSEWAYVYAMESSNLASIARKGHLNFSLRGTGKVSARVAVIFSDAEGARLQSLQLPLNTRHRLAMPEGATQVRFALRLAGPGTLDVQELSLAEPARTVTASAVLTPDNRLLVGKGYPSNARLYHYSFVHRRVQAYREAGLRHAVFRWDPSGLSFDEFEGVDIIAGGAGHLAGLLEQNRFASIEVHPLYPEMWQVLENNLSRTPINLWVHGAEIQPWYRRAYSYPPGPARSRAVKATTTRMTMWREIFKRRHPNLHLIFVSEYLAKQAMADVGVNLLPGQYSIIHNFIDGEAFNYVEKPEAQRKKILSIRPYNSPVYANDLAVKAVLALSSHACFGDLSFLFIGDGELFDSTLEPLRGFPNVEIRRGFLNQRQISELHKEYGVFMVPSRMDSQGVSRDEAMASGLVPVTNAVAAIPEFVDERSGVVAAPEDWQGLADGILEMYVSPELFLSRSRAAAERVRSQSGHAATIERELSLIRGQVDSVTPPLPAATRPLTRLAVYGDLNLNITDGSAVWAVSLVQVLAGLPDTEVTLFLKAPVSVLHIIEPLLALENVRLVEPSAEDHVPLSVTAALDSILERHSEAPFDAVVLRGLGLCSAATRLPQLRDRLWVYITDLPHDPEDLDEETHARIQQIINHARFVLCQTGKFESHMLDCFDGARGKTALLPPMIPPSAPHGQRSFDGVQRIVYAGKFAPLWGIREMLEVFTRLRRTHPALELHVFGDKIHHVPGDLEFRPMVTELLATTPGLVWHKQVSREHLFRELGSFDIGWAWRQPALEEGTHELSTKVLEYAACGLPTVVYPNQVNEEVLGRQYPLFARSADDAEAVIRAALGDRSSLQETRRSLESVAASFEFDAIRRTYVLPLVEKMRAEVAASSGASDEHPAE